MLFRSKAKNFAGTIAVVLVGTFTLAVPTVAHIATWKIVLGLAGLALFVSAGMDKG